MPRKIIFFIKSLLLSLVIIGNVFAAEISIIPVKKPILNEEVKREKISQGILKPKPKPSQKKEEIEIKEGKNDSDLYMKKKGFKFGLI